MTSLWHPPYGRAAAIGLSTLALAGCSHSESDTRDSRGAVADSVDAAALTVVDGPLRRIPWAIARDVYGLQPKRRKLAGPVHAPLTGTLSPAAVPSPVGARVAYNSFLQQRPVLRVHDFVTRKDRVLEDGTYTFAWRRDGALAYFKGLTAQVGDPLRHRGHVFVRASVDARPVRWTKKPALYAVSAWARDRLIVHERRRGWPNLVALHAPGRRRVVAADAALVALSPNGTRAFVTERPNPRPRVSVVDVATGRRRATFAFSGEVDPMRQQPINYVADSGAWAGRSVIAAVTGGLAVFRVTRDEIILTQLFGVDPNAFPLGLVEPKSDATGQYVVAVAELAQRPRAAVSRTALMECELARRRCVLGRSSPSFVPPRPVYDPSRP